MSGRPVMYFSLAFCMCATAGACIFFTYATAADSQTNEAEAVGTTEFLATIDSEDMHLYGLVAAATTTRSDTSSLVVALARLNTALQSLSIHWGAVTYSDPAVAALGRRLDAEIDRIDRQIDVNREAEHDDDDGNTSAPQSLEDLTDVATMTETTGNLLYWDGTAWTNIATSSLGISGGGGAVDSVNGHTGVVVLDTDDLTEGSTNLFSPWSENGSEIYYDSGNVGVGDDTPAALFTVGYGDAFQVTSAGVIASGTWNGSDIDVSDYTNLAVSATGLELSGDSIALATGYTIPLSASTTEWSTAYIWGNHALANYFDKDVDDTDDVTEGLTNLFSQWSEATGGINYAGGNVGIGITNPGQTLAVNGRIESRGGILLNQGTGPTDNLIYVGATTPGDVNASFGFFVGGIGSGGGYDGPYMIGRGNAFTNISGQRGMINFYAGTPDTPTGSEGSINFGTGISDTIRMTVTRDGDVGIGTTTPDQKLSVGGTIQSTDLLGGAVNLTTDANGNIIRDPSDVRLKENIVEVDDALTKVLDLRGVYYDWKDEERFGDQTELGFIAQEVDEILPEVVRKGGDYWSINTRNMLAVVVEGMQEFYQEFTLLKATVAEFANKIISDEIVFDRAMGGELSVEKLCVGDVCVTEAEFKRVFGSTEHEPSDDESEEQDTNDTGTIDTSPSPTGDGTPPTPSDPVAPDEKEILPTPPDEPTDPPAPEPEPEEEPETLEPSNDPAPAADPPPAV